MGSRLGLLKTCFNAWDYYDTAETRHHESVRIDWPALSIVGAATPEDFFSAFLSRDVQGGVVNRFLCLPYEGLKRPPEQQVPKGAQDPPPDLIGKLKALAHAPDSLVDQKFDGRPGKLLDIPWGTGADERYFGFSREMDEEKGSRQVLAMRVPENASRFATNIAVGRFVFNLFQPNQTIPPYQGKIGFFGRTHPPMPSRRSKPMRACVQPDTCFVHGVGRTLGCVGV